MNTEPTAIVGALRAILFAAVLFGLDLTEAQIAAALVAIEAVLTLFLRSRVTPAP